MVPTIDPELLGNRLADVLEFSLRHLPSLDRYSRLWPDDPNEDAVQMRDKVLAETAILVLLASRVEQTGRIAGLIEQLVDVLEGCSTDNRTKELLLRCPHMAAPLGLTQIVLAQRGRGDAETQTILRNIFRDGLADTLERIPYRAMEVEWVESLLNLGFRPDFEAAFPSNVLMKEVHPISMSRSTGYGVTHGLMYATDFGSRPPPCCVDVSLARGRIDAAVAWVLVNDDLDLLIEFIIATTLLRQPWSPYVWLAWDLYNGVVEELGFLPSPSFDPAQFAALQGDEAAAYAFRHVYHTVYVAGLLSAILLAPEAAGVSGDWTAPRASMNGAAAACADAAQRGRKFARVPVEGQDAEAIAGRTIDPATALTRVSDLLDNMLQEHRQWRKVLQAHSFEPALLAQVLGDAAIIHAARRYDLPKLIIAIETMLAMPLPPSPTLIEGALFLARQQLQDGCIGVQFLNPELRELAVAAQTTEVASSCLEACARRFAMA